MKIDPEEICWIVGIVDAYGNVRSVIKTFDDPDCAEPHASIFGDQGTRWRMDNTGTPCDGNHRNITDDEWEAIQNHVIKILGEENCWFCD